MTYVRDPHTQEPLLCCWDDCGQYGHDEHGENFREGGKSVRYIFCSDRHRQYWRHSSISNGNLPAGFRGPSGLIVR